MSDEDVSRFANAIFKEIEEVAYYRAKDIDKDFPTDSVPNAPAKELSTDELRIIEYLNAAQEKRARLEIRALDLQLRMQEDELARRRTSYQEMRHQRQLAAAVCDYFRLCRQLSARRSLRTESADAELNAESRVDAYERKLNDHLNSLPEWKQLQSIRCLLRTVEQSADALRTQLAQEGLTEDSVCAATRRLEAEAGSLQRMLAEARQQSASIRARLAALRER